MRLRPAPAGTRWYQQKRVKMTDRKNATTKEKSAARQGRRVARRVLEKKLGRKLRKGEQVDHIKPKLSKKKYNNSPRNLKAVSKTAHKAKMKRSKVETGGRLRKKRT